MKYELFQAFACMVEWAVGVRRR